MRHVDGSIGLVRCAVVSNIWFLRDAAGRSFLIDSGFPAERTVLRMALWRAGIRRGRDLTAILLTHRHCDHAGNAAWLRRTFDCPVVCHINDASILTGKAPASRLREDFGNPIDRLFCLIENRFSTLTPVDEAVGTGPWRYGFHVIPAFGHTEGSVLFWHEPTKALFTGDALLSGIPPLRFLESWSLAKPAYSLNTRECHRRVLDFLRNPPPVERLCSGHGPYVGTRVREKLKNYRRKWEARGSILMVNCP